MLKNLFRSYFLFAVSIFLVYGASTMEASTLIEALRNVKIVAYPANGREVDFTVASAIVHELASQAKVVRFKEGRTFGEPGLFRVSIADENFAPIPDGKQLKADDSDWMYFKIDSEGSGELVVSKEYLLYATYSQIKSWSDKNVDEFVNGKIMTPAFRWLRNYSDFLVGTRRYARGFNPAAYIKQVASEGFTHITINGLGVPHPFEQGPPGDKYSEFYDYTPDLDQFVTSKLLKGYYPAYYLQANLNFLKRNALLAKKYGLAPGLEICSPRTMPHDFWDKYGFLRGARVDHPRESYLPRYTLTIAHPAVQRSYRELVDNIMKAIPDLSFIEIWSNDSGSGFEFVNRLYAGRNGGPYLVREWKGDDYVARKAAENVLTYYHLILNEARKFNPKFRLIVDLGSFTPLELKYIIPGLGNGIDVGDWSGQSKDQIAFNEKMEKKWEKYGSKTQMTINAANNNSIGAIFPDLVYSQLTQAYHDHYRYVLSETTPASLDPYDVNAEVIHEFQMNPNLSLKEILSNVADKWVGRRYASKLISIWTTADSSVMGFPDGVPYATFGYPWYKLSTRPFVPNIEAIPDSQRAYYEKFMLSTFNNPTRIDLNNDMLWNFLTVQQAAEKRKQFDRDVLPQIRRAIEMTRDQLASITKGSEKAHVFEDVLIRLRTYRHYALTLRDVVAWIEGVHGYIEAKTPAEKSLYRSKVKAMVNMEIENTKGLLDLWEHSPIEFMAVSTIGENMHIYGNNFGQLLKKKLALMEKHENDIPYIDPNFMWHMPKHYPPTL